MQSTFTQLDHILNKHQPLWRFEPFHESANNALPWQHTYPKLNEWLTSLTPEEIASYKNNTAALQRDVSDIFTDAALLKHLLFLPTTDEIPLKLNNGMEAGIPGRKLTQIASMGKFLLDNHSGSSWLEWCSGKGYLGRILASSFHHPVTSLEWQKQLCESGQKEADEKGLSMTFVQGDALSPEATNIITEDQHVVALHACGDLHTHLLQCASEKDCAAITISPCCYHLTKDSVYQPLSELGRNSPLKLTKAELRIPLQETVTGGKRTHRHRELEMTYRLGFDLMLRHELNIKEYLTIPSTKKSELANGFEHFCYWAAEKKGLDLVNIDFAYWQAKGRARFIQMERLSLAQQLFRRALELWLVFDRALFLQEHNYHVSVAQFCNKKVTPRNIIIHAAHP